MNASIDTDVVIHLYLSDKQGLFFEIFDKLYMHEYLYEKELKRKSLQVYVREVLNHWDYLCRAACL